MKISTATPSHTIDVAGNVRAQMGRQRISASQLSQTFGGAVSYWTRRMNGLLPFTAGDLENVALMTECHPAELMGGQAPAGWQPPPPPRAKSAPGGIRTRQPSDPKSDPPIFHLVRAA